MKNFIDILMDMNFCRQLINRQMRAAAPTNKRNFMSMLTLAWVDKGTGQDIGDEDGYTDTDESEDEKELPTSFTPEQKVECEHVSYSFKSPGPGEFQCMSTGLVFDMSEEAELQYKTVQWDESIFTSAEKMPAGPLYDIKCSEDAVSQLQLPHCETADVCSDGLLSVVNITDKETTILEPLDITETHVVVKVPNLFKFGLVWDTAKRFQNLIRPVQGQVLLFLRPPEKKTRILDIFLLQDSVPLDEVAQHQEPSQNIRLSSDCHLTLGESYSVHCEPEDFNIQPKQEQFRSKDGPNFHPTFEVDLNANTEKVTLVIKDQNKKEVWRRDVHLPEPGSEGDMDNQKLKKLRTQFIDSVSDAVLLKLLDKLLEQSVITDGELETISAKKRENKAREVIDTVRKKGPEACSVLIVALCEVDQCLSEALKLM